MSFVLFLFTAYMSLKFYFSPSTVHHQLGSTSHLSNSYKTLRYLNCYLLNVSGDRVSGLLESINCTCNISVLIIGI